MPLGLKFGKTNSSVLVFVSIVQTVFSLAVGIAVITLFMCYVMHMGAWTIRLLDMRVGDLCSIALMASVLLGIAYSTVFKPIGLLAKRSILKKALYSDIVGLSEQDVSEMRFTERLLNTVTVCAVVSGVLAGSIALFAHDGLMDSFGNPLADVLTVLIVIIGPSVFNAILKGVTMSGMRGENPWLYDDTVNALSGI